MRHCLFDPLKKQRAFIKRLSENATMSHLLQSLKSYTNDMYEPINKQLFELGELEDESLKALSKDIDAIFDRVPALTFDIKVYKGIKYKFVAGIYPGYVSTTEDLEVAYKFSSYDSSDEPYLLQIVVPKGFKVLPLEDISVNKGEFEILLPAFTTFKIDGIGKLPNHKPIIMATCYPTSSAEKKKYQEDLKRPLKRPVMDVEDSEVFKLLYKYSQEAMDDFDLEVDDAIDMISRELEDRTTMTISESMKRMVREKLLTG